MMFHPQKAFCNKIFPLIKKTSSVALPLLYLFLILGCHSPKYQQRKDGFLLGVEKIAVVGFKTALSEDQNPNFFRSPISGQTIMADPLSGKVAEEMTFDLFNLLKENSKYSLISPGQAIGAYSTFISQDTGISEIDMLQRTGRSFSADAVLFGYIYRWRERVGTGYGVETPASVAFDLSLLSTDNGSVLWRGIFNKTQVSLSENLLDFSTFIQGKGKWLTSRELARIGLEQLINELTP